MSTEHAARILGLCEQGIAACARADAVTVEVLLLELIAALDFDYEEAAGRLLDLYDAGLGELQAARFALALHIFQTLRAGLVRPEGLPGVAGPGE
jgi:hypothetical protein